MSQQMVPSGMARQREAQMPLEKEVCPPNGESLTSERDLTLYVDTETEVGQTIQVAVWRDGGELTLPVTLAERPR